MSLSEDLKRLANCKTNIKQAIQDKGVQVTSDRFEQYPEFINFIDTDKWKYPLQDLISSIYNEEYGIINEGIVDLLGFDGVDQIAPYALCYKSFDIGELDNMHLERAEIISQKAFWSCKNVPSIDGGNVREIGDNAFTDCVWMLVGEYTRNVSFPQCTRLGKEVFYNCQNLGYITLSTDQSVELDPNGYTFAGNEALTNVEMKWGNIIPFCACNGCLVLENIGDTTGVIEIDYNAFDGCTSMTRYEFPSCEILHSYVFTHNTNLQVISFVGVGQVVQFDGELFSGNGDPEDPTGYSIIVPDGLYNEWIANEKWAKYADHIVKESEFGV